MKTINRLILIGLSLVVFSCTGEGPNLNPNPTGSAGEVSAVMPTPHWKGELGDVFRDIFGQQQPGFYRPEPMFDVGHIPPETFSGIIERKRNLFIFKINPEKYKNAEIKIHHDIWAKHQLVVSLNGPNPEAIISELLVNDIRLIDLVIQEERNRSVIGASNTLNHTIMNQLIYENNIRLAIPVGYKLFVEEEDFYWIGLERMKGSTEMKQYLVIHTYPYTDSSTFTKDFLIAKRDTLMKEKIKGSTDSSYMTTEKMVTPVLKKFYHNNMYTAELRGAYKMVKGAMGGTFVNVSFLDETQNRVVMIEGFVYHPNNDHRNLLRQLESIIYTVDFPPPKAKEATKE